MAQHPYSRAQKAAEAKRSAVTKVVKPGEANSLRKRERAQAKVADVADRVAKLNGQPELVFTVASRGQYHLLAHRPSCKRVIATKLVDQPSRHDAVEPASCCKPAADLVTRVVAAAKAAQADPEPTGSRPTAAEAAAHRDAKAAKEQALVGPEPKTKANLHDRVRDVPTDNPDAAADPDPRQRAELAKAEWKALQAWAKAGEQPPRPATPNLDALNAEYAAGVTAEQRRRQPKGATTTRTTTRTHRDARYTEALTAKKAGGRGAGKAVTDAELDAYVAKVLAADPDAVRNEQLEVAYWLERFAISRPRWNAAWERATAARTA